MADTPLYIPTLVQRNKWRDYRMPIWGNSYTWSWERRWEEVKYVVIHHSVTNPSGDTKRDVDYIAQLHQNRGWGGIGYHFVITDDGTVWYVGDISTARANVADKNELVIGICLVGDFTKTNPTDEQILSAHDLCKFFIDDMPQLVNVNDWSALRGHQDLQATQCPGSSWDNVEGGSMKWRIENRVPYTPQPAPEPTIDWEKRYVELKDTTDKRIEALTAEKTAALTANLVLERKLADKEAECQGKIKELEEKLKNANSQNPEIPGLVDYDASELVAELWRRALAALNISKAKKEG